MKRRDGQAMMWRLGEIADPGLEAHSMRDTEERLIASSFTFLSRQVRDASSVGVGKERLRKGNDPDSFRDCRSVDNFSTSGTSTSWKNVTKSAEKSAKAALERFTGDTTRG
jgi:hypothetical protein